MENINSGSADMDEEVQQVNHSLHALEKEAEFKTPPPKNKEQVCARVCPWWLTMSLTQVSLSDLSWSQVETLLERLKVACTGEATCAYYSTLNIVAMVMCFS